MSIGRCIAVLAFSAALQVQALAQAPEQELGTVEGIITFRGDVPKSTIADDSGVHRELLQVDRSTRGLRYLVIYLTSVNSTPTQPAARLPRSMVQKTQATMDQQDYAFVPRVLAVREGEPVVFTNSDPANHNVRTTSLIRSNEFNVYTGNGGKYEHRFAVQARPIRLGCDIHPWMQGWIYVFDHPHFAVSNDQGRFRIDFVPNGEYKLTLQQPDIRYTHERKVTVSSKQATRIEVEIRAEDLSQPKD
jgi:plastocyanin